jgi:hypothetical protein
MLLDVARSLDSASNSPAATAPIEDVGSLVVRVPRNSFCPPLAPDHHVRPAADASRCRPRRRPRRARVSSGAWSRPPPRCRAGGRVRRPARRCQPRQQPPAAPAALSARCRDVAESYPAPSQSGPDRSYCNGRQVGSTDLHQLSPRGRGTRRGQVGRPPAGPRPPRRTRPSRPARGTAAAHPGWWCRCPGQHHQLDTGPVELANHVDEMPHGAAHPVQLGDDQGVVAAKLLAAAIPLRAAARLARGLVDVDAFAAGRA